MKRFMLATLLLCLFALFTVAQNTNGRLLGTVSGPDGLLPGATVTVTNNETNKTLTATTNDSGGFKFEQLSFGNYTVRVTASGFKTFVAKELKIDASSEYTLNPNLEIGAVSAEVTVEAGAETINSSNAELSSTVSQEQIRELPLNGRNPLSLLNLTAGANPTTDSINGQRSSSQDIRRDGLNVQDNFIRTGAFVSDVPTVDDTAEFSVTTQNAGVQQGGGSNQILLVTPRGGTEYHGNLFIFNRNSYFAANEFFNNVNGVDRPFLNRNQFGGSFSGPLPVPNFGEGGPTFKNDKSFFFFNYEGFRLAQQSSASGTTLLPAARNGTFTFANQQTGQSTTVNVLTGQGFTTPLTTAQGGQLTVDPIIQSRILNALPTSGNGITTGNNFTQVVNFNVSNPEERNSYAFRFDYQANDRNVIGFVYKRNNNADARTDIASGFSTTPFVNQGGPTNFFVASYQTTPTNNFSNDLRGGFNISQPFFRESNVPSDFLIGSLGIITNPLGSFRSQGRDADYRNIQDNAVYTIGNHSIRFGGEAEFNKVTSVNFGGTTPTFNILGGGNQFISGLNSDQLAGISDADLGRANALRFLLGGIIGSASRTANLNSLDEGFTFDASRTRLNYEIYSGYVADQWRARPNLTLNLGLRYEYYTPLSAPDRLFLEPVITDPNNIAASILNPNGELNIIGGNTGKPTTFTNPDRNNFAPSFSFAYTPKFKNGLFSTFLRPGTVIRGGYRVNYVNDEYIKSTSTLVGANDGLNGITVDARNASGTNVLGTSLTPRPGFAPLPVLNTPPTLNLNNFPINFADFNASQGFGSQVFGVDPNLKVQQTQEYNLGIQFALPYKSVLEVRYVGGKSDQLIRTTTFNQFDIRNNGFLEGFRIARQNCAIQGRTTTGGANAFDPTFFCTSADNLGLPGQQDNPIFDRLLLGGILNQSTSPSLFNSVRAFLSQNRAGSLAQFYNNTRVGLQSGPAFLRGDFNFLANPNIFVDEILTNSGKYRYNALQAEIRRRFSNGASFQVNYTFQKTLTNVPDDSQNRQGEIQDNGNPDLDYGRPDYDRTHTVNANVIYELPFGKGKRFLNQGGLVDRIFGGFEFTSIVNLSSGPPLSILDPRSTSTITFQSDRQRAISSLTTDEIKNLFGTFNTPNGIYAINPRVLYATATNGTVSQRIDLTQPLPPGFTLVSVRATSPISQAPFPEQVFFFNKAGQVGNLPLNFINGLPYINWDAGLYKNIRLNENYRVQLRFEAFNVLNRQVPFFGSDLNIDSNNFGRVTNEYNAPRIIQFGARFDF